VGMEDGSAQVTDKLEQKDGKGPCHPGSSPIRPSKHTQSGSRGHQGPLEGGNCSF
jgi:hypothetical protein